VLLLALTPLLYLGEPALALGDPTISNVAMAVVTGLLPIALGVSFFERWRAGLQTRGAVADAIVLVAGLQWCAVLVAWHMLPLALWR
jgi:hypothetical protein